jgi:DNA-binding response OmpR family regulator
VTGSAPDHVLVVDDDDDIREMLQSSLSFAGFRVSTAADARSALAALSETEPDAMVLDVMMPGIDGFDLLQLLRHPRRHPAGPVPHRARRRRGPRARPAAGG